MTTKQILVIDDEARIQEVIQVCLEMFSDWKVITASSGEAGIVQAKEVSPDLILLDVSMPEMDGFTVLQKLQDQPETRSIPVIFLTATVPLAIHGDLSQPGIAGMIQKPFEPITLAAQIAEMAGWT